MVGWALKDRRVEGWGYDEWLWLGRWVGLGWVGVWDGDWVGRLGFGVSGVEIL